MFCVKCKGQKFKQLSRVYIGYSSKTLNSENSWTTYQCLDCKLQKVIKESLSGDKIYGRTNSTRHRG